MVRANQTDQPVASPALLVFDGDCGICSRAVRWLRRHDGSKRIRALPSRTPGLLQQLGVSEEEAGAALWAIADGREHLRGAAAINAALAALRPGPWPLVARLYALPAIRRLEDAAYAWVAAHRGRLSRFGSPGSCPRSNAGGDPRRPA